MIKSLTLTLLLAILYPLTACNQVRPANQAALSPATKSEPEIPAENRYTVVSYKQSSTRLNKGATVEHLPAVYEI
jgi:hypothetical protein